MKKVNKSDKKLVKHINNISESVEQYLQRSRTPWESSISSLPFDLNPEIKLQIIKLCGENNLQEISKKLQIPIYTLKEWISEYKDMNLEEILKKHRIKLNNLPRAKKVELLGEVSINGLEKVLAKYGMKKNTLKSWTKKINSTGIKRFISKIGRNSGSNRIFSKEEKIQIIGEMERYGSMKISNKYDLSDSTIDRWKGRYKLFGLKGLEPLDHNGKRVKMEYSQNIKYEAIQNTDKNGMKDTVLNFGIAHSCVKTWKRQLEKYGYDKFINGEVYDEMRKVQISKKLEKKKGKERVLEGVELLATCGLFGSVNIEDFPWKGSQNKLNIEEQCENISNEKYNISVDGGSCNNISGTKSEDELLSHIVDTQGQDQISMDLDLSLAENNSQKSHEYIDNNICGMLSKEEEWKNLDTNYINESIQNILLHTQNSEIIEDNQPPYKDLNKCRDHMITGMQGQNMKIEDEEDKLNYANYENKVESLLAEVKKVVPPLIFKKYKSVMQILFDTYIKPSFDINVAKITF